MKAGIAKIDERSRISIGRYTSALPGNYFHIEERAEGVLVLTPLESFREATDAR